MFVGEGSLWGFVLGVFDILFDAFDTTPFQNNGLTSHHSMSESYPLDGTESESRIENCIAFAI